MLRKPSIGISEVMSAVGLLVTAIGWFGVTPERFGQMASEIAQLTIPFIDFGLGAWFMHSMLTRKHSAEKSELESRATQAEVTSQFFVEEASNLEKRSEKLSNRIDELENEKIKPDFGYLSEEEKTMVFLAYKDRELFPTPDTSMFAYPDITLSQLQKRNIVQKVCVRKVGLAKIDMWQIEPAASEALAGNPGLRNKINDAYDAAIEKREEEEQREKEELLDGYSCKLSQIDVRSRALLRALTLGYNVYCPSSHWNKYAYEHDALLQNLVGWEYELDSVIQLFPTQRLMEVYRYDPELFERNVGDYLPEREGEQNCWKADGIGFIPRFDFPWYWEKKEKEEEITDQ